jgi:hypothetical protein
MTSNKYAEFAPPAVTGDVASAPAAGPLILPTGYTYAYAINRSTGELEPFIVAEQQSHAPVATTTPVPLEPSVLQRALAYAEQQPDPLPALEPDETSAIDAKTRQFAVLGKVGSCFVVAFGGMTWLVCDGIAKAGPQFHGLAEVLKWAAIAVGASTGAVVLLWTKATTRASGKTGSGEGKTVTALFYSETHKTVNVGKQSGGFKGTVNNNVR